MVSTIKNEVYDSKKILLVKPIDPDGNELKGLIVAIDTVDAGEGDIVMVASEGRAAQEILKYDSRIPLRSIITGIVDTIQT